MQTPGRKGLAVTDRAAHLRLWLTVGLGLALDLATKYLAWIFLGGTPEEGGRTVVVIPDWIRLVATHNPGVVFGMNFAGWFGLGPDGARILTAALTLATTGLIFYVFAMAKASQKWLQIWCGLVMAGALGNLYDRLVFGFVRDLIQITAHFEIGSLSLAWPYVFNVADVYLVVGVAAVALAMLFFMKPAKKRD
jgi:signal peptidase II